MNVRQRILMPLAALAMIPAMAACGGDSELGGEEGKVADRMESFFDAMADGDGKKLCGYILDPTSSKPMAGEMLTQCESSVGSAMASQFTDDQKKEMREAEVKKVTVNGDKATVKGGDIDGVKSENKDEEIAMTKVDGEWYFDAADLASIGK